MKLREGNIFTGVLSVHRGGGYVSSNDHHVSLAGGGCVQGEESEYVQGEGGEYV